MSIIFRAGAIPYPVAVGIMRSIEKAAPACTKLVLSHTPYPRSVGWSNTIDAYWWSGRDYIDLVDRFLKMIPPTDTIEDRMRAIIATNNTLERHLNYTRGFTHEFVLGDEREIISVALPLTQIVYVQKNN